MLKLSECDYDVECSVYQKRIGDCEKVISPHSALVLCLSISLFLSHSLAFSFPLVLCEEVSPQQINCIVTCRFEDAEARLADA